MCDYTGNHMCNIGGKKKLSILGLVGLTMAVVCVAKGFASVMAIGNLM